jgi:hypothetical protein
MDSAKIMYIYDCTTYTHAKGEPREAANDRW